MTEKRDPRQGEALNRGKATSTILADNQKKSNPMFDSHYHFEKIAGTKTKYLLTKAEGEPIPGFPSTYKKGALIGRQYIGMRKMAEKDLYYNYAVCLELAKSTMFTGLNPVLCWDNKYRGFGDDGNLRRRDCVLVEYSRDEMTLDIYFLFGKADKAADIFDTWWRSAGREI